MCLPEQHGLHQGFARDVRVLTRCANGRDRSSLPQARPDTSCSRSQGGLQHGSHRARAASRTVSPLAETAQ